MNYLFWLNIFNISVLVIHISLVFWNQRGWYRKYIKLLKTHEAVIKVYDRELSHKAIFRMETVENAQEAIRKIDRIAKYYNDQMDNPSQFESTLSEERKKDLMGQMDKALADSYLEKLKDRNDPGTN